MITSTLSLSNKGNKSGFTLIEVLISIAILGVISIMVGQSVQQAVRTKDKIQSQVSDVSQLRDALRIIEADVNLAFHYRDVEKEIKALIKKNNTTPAQQASQQLNYNNPADPNLDPEEALNANPGDLAKRIDPATHFIGLENEMNFVTLNNGRLSKTIQQADFVEVGYSLKECKNLKGGSSSGKCLYRRNSSYVDEDVLKGGTEVMLLENVTEFSLRYIGTGKQDWNNTWRTDNAGDGVTKNNFPWAVEVTLATEIKDKGKKKYSMNAVFPIHNPNNAENSKKGGLGESF